MTATDTTAEAVLSQAAKVRDVCWLAKRVLGEDRYREYIQRLDVMPFRERAVIAWKEHMLRCGTINDEARAQRWAIRSLEWPKSEAECTEERKAREAALRQVWDWQDAELKASKACFLAGDAGAKADEHAEKVRLLLEMIEPHDNQE